jgi:CubicO group peptidase (beta-lactamase class C family)
VDALVSYMRKLPREVPGHALAVQHGRDQPGGHPGQQATKKPLATYLAEKVWGPAGMEQQATWLLSKTGQEISGCCMQASPRDYARLGQFILNGAQVNGQSIVPEGWLAEATTKPPTSAEPRARLWLPVVDL